ncbi:hypothetical protein [Streptomyces spinosisporus]|uniref:Uncharacterized protein n=1 Tax=Streptomyces spinosisporus TaxID=2927582 RepID=A0ABS9XDS4_9ACTN|nr:hypothetical protein [Streptomyces spinosisporus]MCI3240240.1 hypothetical protein [Streptomyces spinosisporus]
MISKLAMTAKKTIEAAWLNGPAYDLATQAAEALESSQQLQSPETAAELERLRAELAQRSQDLADVHADREALRARVTKLEARYLPKLCRCGHSKLVHTVPKPHSCFVGNIRGKEPCGCPGYRQLPFAEAERLVNERHTVRSADGITRQIAPTQALRAEEVSDLLTVAPAWHADAAYIPGSKTIELELTASKKQWRAWQEALKVDLGRTTNRGGCVTSHATWRGTHVVILCAFADTPPMGVAE